MSHRRMRDPEFRRSQEAGIWDPHVAPLNRYVEGLRDPDGRGWIPYIAPIYGGIDAEVLNVFRDPGPMTDPSGRGSGFLCIENDDDSAERLAGLMDEARMSIDRAAPWNAYPWYINRKPTGPECTAGVEPLAGLIRLLPRLRVLMLHGGEAHNVGRKLARVHPELLADCHVINTYHTGNQAFIGNADVRRARMQHLRDSFAEAVRQLDQ